MISQGDQSAGARVEEISFLRSGLSNSLTQWALALHGPCRVGGASTEPGDWQVCSESVAEVIQLAEGPKAVTPSPTRAGGGSRRARENASQVWGAVQALRPGVRGAERIPWALRRVSQQEAAAVTAKQEEGRSLKMRRGLSYCFLTEFLRPAAKYSIVKQGKVKNAKTSNLQKKSHHLDIPFSLLASLPLISPLRLSQGCLCRISRQKILLGT